MIFRFFLSMIVGAALFAHNPDAPQAPGPPHLKTFWNLGDNQIQVLALQLGLVLQPAAVQAVSLGLISPPGQAP